MGSKITSSTPVPLTTAVSGTVFFTPNNPVHFVTLGNRQDLNTIKITETNQAGTNNKLGLTRYYYYEGRTHGMENSPQHQT